MQWTVEEEQVLLSWYDRNLAAAFDSGNDDGNAYLRSKWLNDICFYQPESARRIIARMSS